MNGMTECSVTAEVSRPNLAGLITAAVIATVLYSSPVAAQGYRCVPIRQGETPATVARRVTGDARNRLEPWFQILDPATSTFVRKGRYDRIRPGWRACVSTAAVGRNTWSTTLDMWVTRMEAALGKVGQTAGGIDANVILWVALVLAIVLISPSVGDYMTTRQQMLAAMRSVGEAFVREFERPLLVEDEAGRPLRARLRAKVQQRRLEVLLAPAAGRRYPNLADHKKNVEYDVSRVLQRLRAPAIVGGALYAQGQWVVVPLEFTESSQQAGGK